MAPNYHLELRHFPRTSARFNQTGTQVGAIVIPWVQDRVLELDGEKWAPYESTITILEGPPIALEQLSMGRGWSAARRQGTDVTERILSEARRAVADGSAYAQGPPAGAGQAAGTDVPGRRPAESSPASEPPAAEDHPSLAGSGAGAEEAEPPQLPGLLGADSTRLLAAWRRVAARTGGLAPSESLALAERELQREDRPPA